ncbi:MAG: hypothetical protein ACRDTJ_09810, partial [Pseudonocardiaceae bacterium]
NGAVRGLRNLPNEKGESLTDIVARRPELRDVGIAGYLVGAAVEGAPGMPPGPLPCDCGCSPRALVRFGRSVAA